MSLPKFVIFCIGLLFLIIPLNIHAAQFTVYSSEGVQVVGTPDEPSKSSSGEEKDNWTLRPEEPVGPEGDNQQIQREKKKEKALQERERELERKRAELEQQLKEKEKATITCQDTLVWRICKDKDGKITSKDRLKY